MNASSSGTEGARLRPGSGHHASSPHAWAASLLLCSLGQHVGPANPSPSSGLLLPASSFLPTRGCDCWSDCPEKSICIGPITRGQDGCVVEGQWTHLALSPAPAFSRLLSVYPRLAPCLHAVCQVGGLSRLSRPCSQRPIWTHRPNGQAAGNGSGRPSAAREPSEGLSPALTEPYREHHRHLSS